MPPINDNIANAIVLTGNAFNVTGTNVDATAESGEEAIYSAIYTDTTNSVWYSYTPTQSGLLSLDTLQTSPDLDTIIWVFTGTTINTLKIVAYNDDANIPPFPVMSLIVFPVTAGVTYMISVTGYNTSIEGDFVLNGAMVPAVVNDNFTQAQSATISSFPISYNNQFATTEIGEPTNHYTSLWYAFTSTNNGLLDLSASDNWVDYFTDVYTGNNLTELSPVNPIAPGIYQIFAGIIYKISVYAQYINGNNNLVPYSDGTLYGPETLTGTFQNIVYAPNDAFSDAFSLNGTTFSQSADNSLATTDLYEDPTNYFSLWYSFRSTSSVYFTLAQTAGISLNFKVYNGIDIENAIEVASSNDSIGVVVIPNVTYYIAVSSQSPTSYGEFSFGGGVGEFPFVYIGPTSPSLVLNFNGLNSLVVDSNGTIFSLNSAIPSIYRSSDKGNTWTLDRSITLGNPPYGGAKAALFLDENGNLVLCYATTDGVSNYYFNISVRNKSTTTWTDYTSSAMPAIANVDPFGMTFCQGDDQMIHCVLCYHRNTCNGWFGIANNIYYCNYKDGVISTPASITQYNTQENVFCNNQAGPQIVNHQGGIFIFWLLDTEQFQNGNGNLQYCQITPSAPLIMDAVEAAKAWITDTLYYVGDLVNDSVTIYKCLTQHTSGTFLVDLGHGDWQVLSSYVTPTIVPALANNGLYNIKSDGTNLYFCAGNGFSPTLSLYENYVNISVSAPWYAWMTLTEFEIAMNGDIVVYGVDNRVFGGEPSVVARIGGVWQPEHTGLNNAFVGGHTYNFAIIR